MPGKMLWPVVTPWMKQRRKRVGIRVNASNVGSFMIVAGKTGQGQIL